MDNIANKVAFGVGSTVMLKSPNLSSHKYFTWDTGIVKEFSNDMDECKIMSTVNGSDKTFVEFVDNLKEVKDGN